LGARGIQAQKGTKNGKEGMGTMSSRFEEKSIKSQILRSKRRVGSIGKGANWMKTTLARNYSRGEKATIPLKKGRRKTGGS